MSGCLWEGYKLEEKLQAAEQETADERKERREVWHQHTGKETTVALILWTNQHYFQDKACEIPVP